MEHRVHDHLITVLHGKFEVPTERITPEATLGGLELDSLAVVELFVTLQEGLDVLLDDSQANGDMTVGELSETVQRLLADTAGRNPR
ncbi:acyl carrier protein [Streptomyces sp. NPDC015501]|uniref:acyl carrier protein n=1 Tax=unclassified Streptomyces TaxID=2593676 RepID=UPI0011A4DE4C|nr:acyl carrier protein [Streptomyces griseus subsp. griseus]